MDDDKIEERLAKLEEQVKQTHQAVKKLDALLRTIAKDTARAKDMSIRNQQSINVLNRQTGGK